ncbi:MAG: hypothetical protein ACJ8AS_10245 [Hyphomicrobiales bacterium]
MLKLLMAFVAGVLTFLTLRHLLEQLKATRAGAIIRRPGSAGPIRRLRRDPVTGVYVPESS